MIDTSTVPFDALIFGLSTACVLGLSAGLTGWLMSRLTALFNQ
jgi:hypothetical protein